MHHSVARLLPFFLDEDPTPLTGPFYKLAEVIAAGPQNPETTVALRKLLESKDAAIRAVIEGEPK